MLTISLQYYRIIEWRLEFHQRHNRPRMGQETPLVSETRKHTKRQYSVIWINFKESENCSIGREQFLAPWQTILIRRISVSSASNSLGSSSPLIAETLGIETSTSGHANQDIQENVKRNVPPTSSPPHLKGANMSPPPPCGHPSFPAHTNGVPEGKKRMH